MLKGIIIRAALALWLIWTGKAHADPLQYFCSKGYAPKEAALVVNKIGSASVLYIEGQKPNLWPHQRQVVVGSTDPLDLKATEVWIVDDRIFWPCKKLPGSIKLGAIEDEVPLTENGIRPAASP